MNTRAPLLSALMSILRSAGPGDLDPPVTEVGWGLCHAPVTRAHVGGVVQELERGTGRQRRAAL